MPNLEHEQSEIDHSQENLKTHKVRKFLGSVALSTVTIGVVSEVMNITETTLYHHSLGIPINVGVATAIVTAANLGISSHFKEK